MIYLGYEAIHDCFTREISLPPTVPAALVGILSLLSQPPDSILSLLIRLVPGLLLMGLAFISRGALGLGDGLVILIMGLYLPFKTLTVSVLTGFFVSSLYAAVLFLIRPSVKTQFPFLPFLFAGHLLTRIIAYL